MHLDSRRLLPLALGALLLQTSPAAAFYIPGVSVKVYPFEVPVPLYVNKIFSDQSQLTFAYSEQPFVCPIKDKPLSTAGSLIAGTHVGLNLGELLRGDRIMLSDYKLHMGQDVGPTKLCDVAIGHRELLQARDLIASDYRAEWIVDNLPGATSLTIHTGDGSSQRYNARGFALGFTMTDPGGQPQYFLNNHFSIVIRYRTADGQVGQQGGKVIVGFEVFPKSFSPGARDQIGLPKDVNSAKKPMELTLPGIERGEDTDAKLTIPYSYSVMFKEDNTIDWANRWDRYMVPQDSSKGIHWLAIINSLSIAGLLAAITAVILTRTIGGQLRSRSDVEDKIGGRGGLLDPMDRRSRAEIDDEQDEEEVTGWKLVHADVFRAPSNATVLAAFIGSGVQLAFVTTALLVLSCVGILNPSYRGGFASIGAGMFVFGGAASGYYAARVYKTFGGEKWRANALLTAALVPAALGSVTMILNLLAWSQMSSTALPFTTILALFAMWIFVQLPCAFVGAYLGFVRHGAYQTPIKPSAIARQIPAKPWWAGSSTSILLAGCIPFAAIFIELVFILKSVWLDKSSYYYLFGFALAVFAILVVTVVELTVVTTYFLLCYEDYRWHWHSFFTAASSGVWVFGYCVYYFFMRLHLDGAISALMFFSWSAIACSLYGLTMGTLGYATAATFVSRIYTAVKVD